MRARFRVAVAVAASAGLVAAVPAVTAAYAEPSTPDPLAYGGGGWNGGNPWYQDGTRGPALPAFGLTTNNRLVRFYTAYPQTPVPVGTVSGLVGDASLVGIDFRVSNRVLYGVGNAGGVYTLNTSNAVATKIGQLSVALAGTAFGVDVNPVADALRIVSNTGQNLRFSFAAGTTTADGGLNYNAVAATGISGAAYTNNDTNAATGTTLFDLDTNLDQLAIQSPPNAGALVGTGALGVNAGPSAGLDVYTWVRGGKAVDNTGFAAVQVGGGYGLYGVNLLTGEAVKIGNFPVQWQVFDVAVLPAP
jgi:uncharacterized protein DUF4394